VRENLSQPFRSTQPGHPSVDRRNEKVNAGYIRSPLRKTSA